jgi:putative nucleotidyltransferase with HDIG domain
VPALINRLAEVNKELWLLLTMFVIAAVLNFTVDSHHMVLGLYAFPTIFSAYYYGRNHAVLTAVASVLLVVILAYINPQLLTSRPFYTWQSWADLTIWGGLLMVTAYAMGTLYEHRARNMAELRDTYQGVLMILCHFISKDNYTQNHCYRVSVYATQIAAALHLSNEEIEDVRAAALLHDIGKLDVSRDLLYKAARLTEQEYQEMSKHVDRGAEMLGSVGGSLRRVIPLILAHHDKFDGSGQHEIAGDKIPLGARIIAVADVYDALTSDRPYRKALAPFEAKQYILEKSGAEFDPGVVSAFDAAFRVGMMEVPEVLV